MAGCSGSCGFGDTEVDLHERLVYEADELALKAGLRPSFDWDDNGNGSNACVVAHRRFTETDLEQAHATFPTDWRDKYPFESLSGLIVCAIDSDL